MSAEATHADPVARYRPTSPQVTIDRADALLEETLAGLTAALTRAASDGDPADRREAEPGPLAVDLTGELADRSRHHGKRLRPLLAHWGWVLAGAPEHTHADLTRVAAALELLQLFALVQDDVMDRSDSRRGLPTLHVTATDRHRTGGGVGDPELFGDSVAVLVSDLALSEASLLVAPTSTEVRAAWRLMAVELVEGQLLDVTHTADRRRDLATSRRIARFKSGRYTISRPLQLGALVAGADADLVRRLITWGDLVGDAFALRDDVLGIWGDPEQTGKPAGDDLRSGKPTALLVWAGELLPDGARPLLAACDDGTLDDAGVDALADAMQAAGVRDRAEAAIADTAGRALDRLPDLAADDEAAAALRALVESIAWRSA
ncbi:polyprenyl synthetase family protein [Oryzobacter telluris]|uniref:polyprenyl synthetase family protein n=1 Tax=Oryzobacter telluris TaxID=3149179 RepID=UPI00370D28CE